MIETWIDSGMLLNRKNIQHKLFYQSYRAALHRGQLSINEVLLNIVEDIDGNVWRVYLIKEGYDKACRMIIRHIRAEYSRMTNLIQLNGQVDLRETAQEVLYRLANAQQLREGGFDFFEEERRVRVYPGQLEPGEFVWDDSKKRAVQVKTKEEIEEHIYNFRTGVSIYERFATPEEAILHIERTGKPI